MIKKPMKGEAVTDLSIVRLPKLVAPKIDGFRCLLARTPMSSRLKHFPNRHVHQSLSRLVPHGDLLDGEIVVGKHYGKGVLQRTSSGITSQNGEPDFTLWVFDRPLFNSPALGDKFIYRLASAKKLVKEIDHPCIKFLEHQLISTPEELQAYIDLQLKKGFEGIFMRDPKGGYKEGKSSIIQQWGLKYKPFTDAEGIVIGYYEEMENTNVASRDATGKQQRSSAKAGKVAKDQLGGLILKDNTSGVEVRVGGGFTLIQRQSLWKIRKHLGGLRVRYKKQLVGEKNKPRHPNFIEFVDFRPEWDE